MMMARKKQEGLGEKHKKLLGVIERYSEKNGYPPSIREMCKLADISSTSVANYYLNQLEEMGYIERGSRVSRGVKVLKSITETVEEIKDGISELLRIPVVGRIVASEPAPVPSSNFNYYDAESAVDVARSLLPERSIKPDDLFALEVQGDSMIDAMVNDGDIVIMKKTNSVNNGEMAAIWLTDRDETTLKFFHKENDRIRLQPANPLMDPIIIDKPEIVQIQGSVVMVIRQVDKRPLHRSKRKVN